MEVHFTPELQAKLDRVAADIRRGADEYVQQLVEHYLDHDVWFRHKVKDSLEQLDRGEFLTHEEVGARLVKMFQSYMQIRWSPAAAEDLDQLFDYIRPDNPVQRSAVRRR